MSERLEHTFHIGFEELDANLDVHRYLYNTYINPFLDDLREKYKFSKYYTTQVDHESTDAYHFRVSIPEATLIYAPNTCHNCGKEIKIAIFKGGAWCSDNCRKALGEDL